MSARAPVINATNKLIPITGPEDGFDVVTVWGIKYSFGSRKQDLEPTFRYRVAPLTEASQTEGYDRALKCAFDNHHESRAPAPR